MIPRRQKIIPIGSSAGVLLRKEWLEALGLKPGDEVFVVLGDDRITLVPAGPSRRVRVDARFAARVEDFLDRHGEVLRKIE